MSMTMNRRSAATALALLLTLPCALAPAKAAADDSVERKELFVPMRDGVKLRTLLFRRADAMGKAPTLMLRNPYDQKGFEDQARRLAAAGYNAIVQYCRGRMGSEGSFVFYWGEGPDGFDTVEWIRKQPWSDGRSGMWGPSYMGSVQWLTAAERTPLTVICPTAAAANFYYNVHCGGTYMLAHARTGFSIDLFGTPPPGLSNSAEWSKWYLRLPLTKWGEYLGYSPPWQVSMIEHDLPDGFWKGADVSDQFEHMNFPAQHFVGYYDFMCRETVRNFQAMRTRSATPESRANQQLVIGPWDHGTGNQKIGDVDFGPEAKMDWVAENLKFFDRFLKTSVTSSEPLPPVRYFSMGDNAWHVGAAWPPLDSKPVSFYVHSGGKANTRAGDGRLDQRPPTADEAPDQFKADPMDPVPAAIIPGTKYPEAYPPYDQKAIEDLPDVLVYSTPPVTEPLRFAGPLTAEVYGSTDTEDADWVVKLIDVHPDGYCHPLAAGVLRGSARESDLHRSPLVPGQVYRLTVDLGHAAATIAAGHSLRIHIASGNFPIFDRNKNVFEGPTSSKTVVANERVFHTAEWPTRLVLPVIEPGGDADQKAIQAKR